MALSFVFLKDCKPCELLRVKINDVAEFAILGAREGHAAQWLVVLKRNEPPFAINLVGESGRIDGDFDTYAALRYGKFEIFPEHTDRSEIGEGELFKKSGSLILSDDTKFLVVKGVSGGTVRYFDLAEGKLRGEPSGSRAAFKAWSLWYEGDRPAPTSTRLIDSGDRG